MAGVLQSLWAMMRPGYLKISAAWISSSWYAVNLRRTAAVIASASFCRRRWAATWRRALSCTGLGAPRMLTTQPVRCTRRPQEQRSLDVQRSLEVDAQRRHWCFSGRQKPIGCWKCASRWAGGAGLWMHVVAAGTLEHGYLRSGPLPKVPLLGQSLG